MKRVLSGERDTKRNREPDPPGPVSSRGRPGPVPPVREHLSGVHRNDTGGRDLVFPRPCSFHTVNV